MKKILLLFYFFFFVLLTKDGFCQNPLVKQWDYRFGGSGVDGLYSLKRTADGGYILGGWSDSPISGDKTQNTWGLNDYWIVKIDSLGNKQWDRDFGGNNYDYLNSLQQTADRGYILGGYSNSPISGNKTQNTWGNWDYWILKIDSLGNKIWDKDFGGNNFDYLYSLNQTADGGYILGGYSYSPISGNKTQNTWGFYDYWIIKIDSLGNEQWDKDYGGTSYDFFYSLQQTFDGGYILGGVSNSPISGDKTENTRGGNDYWVVKIDPLGNKQWDKDFGGAGSDYFSSLQQTADGGYILAGYSESPSGGDKTQNTYGGLDYWIVKIDSLGNKQWDKDFGGTDDDDEYGNAFQTSDYGYLIAGTSFSPISGDKTENNLGAQQTWIVKTDSLGSKKWDKTIFTTGHDETGLAVQSIDECFVIANKTNAGIGGYKTQTSRGSKDYWIIKFCDTTLTTSISNIQSPTSNFTIFPNPANDFITISFTQGRDKNVSMEVYDLLGTPLTPKGELLLSKSGNMKIDISDFIPGVYIVEIKKGNDCYRKKIIKM